jgi:predicted O-methyltransferase YrrM
MYTNLEQLIIDMEHYALEHDVPIIFKDGIDFLKEVIYENEVSSILEVGTAIGYSAIQMASVRNNILVETVERDEVRYNEAIKNVEHAEMTERIDLNLGDALLYEPKGTYDLIFIDAAKSQYTKFFEMYKVYLKPGGIIVSDNLHFHGHVAKKERIQSKNLRQLVGKIRRYVSFLEDNEEFDTEFFDVGDGIALSRRKSE